MTKKYVLIAAACAVLLIVLITLAVKSSKPAVNASDVEFAKYVSAYTKGIINKDGSVKIVLNSDMAEQMDKSVNPQSLLKFYPSVSGDCKIVDNRTIEFTPKKGFKNGQDYTVEFLLNNLFKSKDTKKKNFVFAFSVVAQDLSVVIETQNTIDKKTLKYQRITGVVRTADLETVNNIKNCISAKYNGQKIEIKFRETEDKLQNFPFVIDSLERGDNTQELVITYDGIKINSKTKGEKKIEIPSVNDFNVSRLEVVHSPNQCLKLFFSDPLKENQNLDGLVLLSENSTYASKTEFKMEIDDNCINIYPDTKKRGEMTVTISSGIENVLGVKLPEDKVFKADFDVLKPQVRAVKTGLILPESGSGLVYPFEAVNLKAVDVTVIKVLENNILSYIRDYSDYWNESNLMRTGIPIFRQTVQISQEDDPKIKEWNRYYLELSKLINAEPGTIYDIKISFRKSLSVFDCDSCAGGDDTSQEKDVSLQDFDNAYNYSVDDEYFSSAGYNWNNTDNPCSKMYYRSEKFLQQCILASNIGVIAKKGDDNTITVYATDLRTAKPISGATVELYGYQQQLLMRRTSDGEGKAEFQDQKKAYFAVVRNGAESNYLKLEDGNSLSLSKFDISGIDVKEGLRGYIYGERGVWRPGDSIHLSFILKEETDKPLPLGYPITLEVKNPYSQQIIKETVSKNATNFYVFNFKTQNDAVTGLYHALVTCGNSVFSKSLRVENIKPNRLKIFAKFNKDFLTKDENYLDVQSSWLHGAKASNLKFSVDRALELSQIKFDNFPGYTFNNFRMSDFDGYMQNVGDGVLDSEGKGRFLDEFKTSNHKFPNKMRAKYELKVFEKGGSFSKDVFSVDVYPFDYYFGIKMPEEKNRYLYVNKTYTVDLASVTPKGVLDTKSHKISVSLYKLRWQYWYDSDNYVSDYNSELLNTQTLEISGRAHYNFQVQYPDWGRYMIEVKDLNTGICSSEIFYMDWPDSFGRSPMLSQGSTVLELSSPQSTYKIGEKVIVNIPSPENGRALISIETGTKVLRSQWINVESGNTEFQFNVDEKMVPGVYVFVTLLQPHGQTINDLPIRMYGVLPVNVVDEKTKLEPEITIDDKLEAESEVSVTVSEKNSKTMTYTIALVDDGVLDLTHFKTPNAWQTFYSRPSLKIKTFDMFDNVIGAFGGKLDRLLTIGGDDGYEKTSGSKANNFETVVKFLGPFTYSGKKQTHKIKLPKYVGSVRTMVVAGNGKAFGSAEKTSIVSKPLMIFATTPRILSTGDKFSLPLTVFTGQDNIKDVKVSIKATGGFSAVGPTSQNISFVGKGEQNPVFELQTSDTPGIGTIEITATSGQYKSEYKLNVEIRQPNVKTMQVISKLVEQGQTVDLDFAAVGRKNTNEGKINVGAILPMNIDYHLSSIMSYSYETLHSLVSQGFALLYANELSDMPNDRKDSIENAIRKIIERIYDYQASTGGLSYWRGNSYTDVYMTSYAGHFVLEAQKAGYLIQKDFLDKWKKYQKIKAETWTPDNASSYQNQAYRLYTLALCNEAMSGQMNRLKQQQGITADAILYLSLAYSISGKADIGKKMLNSVVTKDGRDLDLKLLALTSLNEKERAFEVAKKLSDKLSSDNYWWYLQDEASSLFALAKYFQKYKPSGKVSCSYVFNSSPERKVNSDKLFVSQDLKYSDTEKQTLKFTNTSSGNLYVEILNYGIPEAGNEKAESSILSAKVLYRDDDSKLVQVEKLSQGDEFVSEIRIKNTSGDYLNNLVITEMFASGWEITDMTLEEDNDDYDYYSSYNSKYSILHVDTRDDRKYTYFSLASGAEIVFKTRLTAAYKGEYYLPGIVCESLDDNKIFAKTKGKIVKVE